MWCAYVYSFYFARAKILIAALKNKTKDEKYIGHHLDETEKSRECLYNWYILKQRYGTMWRTKDAYLEMQIIKLLSLLSDTTLFSVVWKLRSNCIHSS